MINAILKGIFKLVISLVNVLLTPIDAIISSALPSLATALTGIASFLSLVTSSIGWVLSVFGLSSECLALIVVYFTFKLSVPVVVSAIKLAIRWYDKLKP